MELHYKNWNKSGADQSLKKMVFLHGMGGTGHLWKPIVTALEDEINLITLDQRGHGQSQIAQPSPETRYRPLDYGQDVIDTLRKLNFYPTWLVGHSMGVRTAVAAAHLQPKWVKGLILIDLGFSGIAGGGLGESLFHFLSRLPKNFLNRNEARVFMAQNCPDPAIAQYLMAVTSQDADGKISFPFDHQALLQTIQEARGASIQKWCLELAEQGMPFLVLRGERSSVWTHAEFLATQEIFASFPQVVFQEVAEAGHGLPFEQRAVFLSLVRKFIGHL